MRAVHLALVMSLVALPVAAQVATGPATGTKDSVPTTGPALQKRLDSYDPRAVAAARHYYMQPAIKAGMLAITDNMNTAMSNLVAQQNPSLSPEQLETMRKVIGEATKERLDLILQMSMVNALDTFSTSPEGASILAKMPKLAQALPSMMRTIMPGYLADVKARVKQNGAELKL